MGHDSLQDGTASTSARRIRLIACLFFCLTLSWSVLLFQGLPASDIDDWDKIILARETPWSQFASSFLTPWSQSHNWVGQTDRYDEVQYKRIVLPMFLKFSQQCFGLNPFAMYFLTKGIFFAGCVMFVFLMLAQIVPWLYAILGTLVFLFVPAHYSHVLWIADTVTLCYFFLFLGIWIFYKIQKNIFNQGSNRQFRWMLFALFVTGWIGIKAKEPMLVLPMTVFLSSVACFQSWKQAPVKYLSMNVAMALVAFQIIPVMYLNGGALPNVHFDLTTISRLLFRNYECGYDNEVVSTFFSWDHVFPVSIARTLGFFMLWTIIITGSVFIWRRYIAKSKDVIFFWSHPMVRICGVWFLAELPFLGMFQPDPRYFSGTMAPLIVMIARLSYCAVKGGGRSWGIGLLLLWTFSVGFNIFENAQNSLSVRIMLGRKLNYFWGTARTIFKDMGGGKPVDDLAVGKFYCSLDSYRDRPGAIKNHLYYALGLSYDGWNKVKLDHDSIDDFKFQSKKGYAYYVTIKELDVSGKPEIKQIGTVNGINKDSLLERWLFKKKKKRPAVLRVLKCS
ncbi:MAG: hypothetical protein WC484_00225 [Candidatus Omnitrophota bacterium]